MEHHLFGKGVAADKDSIVGSVDIVGSRTGDKLAMAFHSSAHFHYWGPIQMVAEEFGSVSIE